MKLDHAPDFELVTLARRGNRDAFGTLVSRYLRRALAAAWEYAPTRDDAEDLVQDAFHRALLSLDRFDETRQFGPWFFTILRNVGRNAAERNSRWTSVAVPDELPTEESDPEDETHRSLLRDSILEGLDVLPQMQRTCFRLCDIEGFEGTEVAEMLGLSAATVRTHRHRARATLRAALERLNKQRGA